MFFGNCKKLTINLKHANQIAIDDSILLFLFFFFLIVMVVIIHRSSFLNAIYTLSSELWRERFFIYYQN